MEEYMDLEITEEELEELTPEELVDLKIRLEELEMECEAVLEEDEEEK